MFVSFGWVEDPLAVRIVSGRFSGAVAISLASTKCGILFEFSMNLHANNKCKMLCACSFVCMSALSYKFDLFFCVRVYLLGSLFFMNRIKAKQQPHTHTQISGAKEENNVTSSASTRWCFAHF